MSTVKPLYEADSRHLTLRFDERDELERFLDTLEANAGFLVQLSTALKLHDPVTVVLETDGAPTRFEARVAQVFDKGFGSFGTAFLVDDPTAPRRLLERPETAGEGVSAEPIPEALSPGAEAPERAQSEADSPGVTSSLSGLAEEPSQPVDEGAAGEMMGTSPIHRINAMNPRQRARLAQRAGRTERQILLRDKSPLVLESLLNNPRIDSEEVLRIARSSRVVAPTLQRIANDSRWNSNQEILAVIARHPKTPSVFAIRLLPSLRTPDLKTMAKMSSGLREMVRKAALREYMQRTGQRI